MKRKVLIIYTGGTIGMEKNYETGSLEPFDFRYIFEKLPEVNLLQCEVAIHPFQKPLDSSDIGPKEWSEIASCIKNNYHKYDGFLVLHGTDTMSYTASALSFMLRNIRKPVILTGAQLPIGDLRTDAKENLLTSLNYVSIYDGDEAVIQEVAVYFAYKLMRGNRSLKYSSEYFDAYQSPNYQILGHSGVNLTINRDALYRPKEDSKFYCDLHFSSEVIFWRIFPGMSFDILENIDNVKVIILQVFGSGTIFNNKKTEVTLKKLRHKGIEIIIISQCISGEISFGKYSNSNIFKNIGAINGKDLTAETAIIKAMHILDNPKYQESFAETFQKNICGEIK